MAPSLTYNPAAFLELDTPAHAALAAPVVPAPPVVESITVHDAEMNGSLHADARKAFRENGATEGRNGLAADGLTANLQQVRLFRV